MRPTDPFAPFRAHVGLRDRRLWSWRSNAAHLDDFLDAPDRTALHEHFASPRIRGLVVVTLALAALLVWRLIDLQIVNGATYRDRAERNRVRRVVRPAPRGVIIDRWGVPLTKNEPAFLLMLRPEAWERAGLTTPTVVSRLVATAGLDPTAIESALNDLDRDGTTTIRGGLTKEQAIAVERTVTDIPGLDVTAAAARTYPLGAAASHLLGYLGRPTDDELARGYATTDTLGRSGLEAIYEDALKGQNGVEEVERDSTNRTQRIIATIDPTPGQDLPTTIDAALQQQLADALDASVRQSHAPGGAAVALDPRTGEILALVSTPGFDPTALSKGLSSNAYRALATDQRKPLFNRAVSGEYPSGSTIKPFIAAAALAERVISSATTVRSSGGLRVGHWFFPDWKPGGHGLVDVRQAIAESVNTFFYTIGGGFEDFPGLGLERMTAYARRFGFGHRLGVDLPAEAAGFLPSKEWKERTVGERWYIGDTYHFAIGQGDLLVTPLQLAVGTAAIANGGTVYRPHLTRQSDRTSFEPEPLASGVVADRALTTVRQGMRQAVTEGSARSLNDLPVPAAGKTGTAQVGGSGATHAWFTAFAPYDDPRIVVTVLVERGGEGHAAALPVARAALLWYLTHRTNQ